MQLEFSDMMKKEFQRLHSLEWQLLDSLKMLSGAAQDPQLKQALEHHLKETQTHLERLEMIGEKHGFPVIGLPNLPMKALALELLEDWGGAEPGPVTDAMIIGAAQKGEHLEMAWYGMLRNFCLQVGDEQSAAILEQSLEDEKRADKLLSEIAEASINRKAATMR